MLDGAPRLLWLLAVTAVERRTPWAELEPVAAQKRRKILAWCGGRDANASVKAIERDIGLGFVPGALTVIRHLATDPEQKTRFERKFERAYPDLVGSLLHREAERDQQLSKLMSLYRDVLRLANHLGDDALPERARSLQHLAALQKLHDDLVDRLIAEERKLPRDLSADRRFPTPPLRGTRDIIPIRTERELAAEGRLMHHCCGTYGPEIHAKELYVYRVLRPGRATLSIDLTGKRPRIDELRGERNALPDEETVAAVKGWLRERFELMGL